MSMGKQIILSLVCSAICVLLVCQADVREELKNLDLKESGHSIQMVDNDPEFLVGVRGKDKPLCFHLEGSNGDVIRLLQDPVTDIVVNARLFHDTLFNKTYLGAIMIAQGNFQIIAKQRYVMINNIKVGWNDMESMDVQGHRVVVGDNTAAVTFRKHPITLIIKRHFATVDTEMDYDPVEESSNGKFTGVSRADIMPLGSQDQKSREVPATQNRVLSSKRRRSLLVQNFFNVKEDKTVLRNLMVEVNNHKRSSGAEKHVAVLDASREETQQADKGYEEQLLSMSRQNPRRRRHQNAGTNVKRGSRNQRELDGDVAPDDVATDDGVEKKRNKTIFLGVYISVASGFSNETHGLLGQFLFKYVKQERILIKNGRMRAIFMVNGNPNRRTVGLLTLRRNLAMNTTLACWKIDHQGRDVVDGWYMDYLVANLRNADMKDLPPSSSL